jgi:hypothetical protein
MRLMKARPRNSPPRWVTQLYRCLAAGRYAVEWLPEFLILFDQIVDKDGEEAAFDWALRELLLSLKPSLAVRIERAIRFVHRVWKIYRRTVGD